MGERMPGTDWVVHDVVGQGGMGIVLEAVRKGRTLRAAMKVLRRTFARSPREHELSGTTRPVTGICARCCTNRTICPTYPTMFISQYCTIGCPQDHIPPLVHDRYNAVRT
jgi:hypothetical protein